MQLRRTRAPVVRLGPKVDEAKPGAVAWST